ncbi:RHS repeat-associated core domain-containing protein [Lacihabitans sp. CS3-21]|nr:DUF6443 domain-containing protein [Lacihabitans sp. CS3-21]MCP9747820.1 RHS repeat-associated core domain-containing protein [Lacihabitans sp. CS3-21]
MKLILPILFTTIFSIYGSHFSLANSTTDSTKNDSGQKTDCIGFKIESTKNHYTTGDLVNIRMIFTKFNLEGSWAEKDCGNFYIKLVVPEEFVVTGGEYYDFMNLTLTKPGEKKEIILKGYFKEQIKNAEFILIKDFAKNIDPTAIYVKKQSLFLHVTGESIRLVKKGDINPSNKKTDLSESKSLTSTCDPNEPNDTPVTTTNIGSSTNYLSGDLCIEPSDEDFFIWNYNGHNYIIKVRGYSASSSGNYKLNISVSSGILTLTTEAASVPGYFDSYLHLYDESGYAQLAQNDDGNGNGLSKIVIDLNCYKPGMPVLSQTNVSFVYGQSFSVSANYCNGTINWYRNNVFISSGNSITLQPNSSSYAIEAGCTPTSGCESDRSSFLISGRCSINEIEPNESLQAATDLGNIILPFSSSIFCFNSGSDNDFYRFNYSGKTYYIKVRLYSTGNNLGAYILKVSLNGNNLEVSTDQPSGTYISSLNSLDTWMELYDENAFSIGVSDDIQSSINLFSKISINLVCINPGVKADKLLICPGETVQLYSTGCSSGLPSWTNSNGYLGINQTVNPTTSISYQISCDNSGLPGCPSNSTGGFVLILVNPLTPAVLTSNKSSVCITNTNGSDGAILSASNCAGQFLWSTGQQTTSNTLAVYPTSSTSYWVKCVVNSECITAESNLINITVNAVPDVPIIQSGWPLKCTNYTSSPSILSVNNCIGTVIWSNGQTGPTISVTPNFTTSYTAYCQNSCGNSQSSAPSTIEIVDLPTPVMPNLNTSICLGQPIYVDLTGQCPNDNVIWGDGRLGPIYEQMTFNEGPYSLQAACYTYECTSSYSNSITFNISNTVGSISFTQNPINSLVTISTNVAVSAVVTPANTGITYNWTGPNGFVATGSTANINNIQLANGGIYTVSASIAGGCPAKTATVQIEVNSNCECTTCGADGEQIKTINPTANENFVSDYRHLNYIVENTYLDNTDQTKIKQRITYIDGLGRALQSFDKNSGGNSKNIVQHYEYDNFGREAKKYLPLPFNPISYDYINLADNGSTINGFYQSEKSDANAFAETEYENSALQRIKRQGNVGADWKLNNPIPHLKTFNYRINVATDEVINLNFDFTSVTLKVVSTNYANGELWVTEMTDENGNLSREYKNREGQIVCKDEAANNTTITTRTYYVYDDMGKLRYVIQPKAEAYLKTKVANNLINLAPNGDASIRDLVFTYFYDPNGLLIEKRMPGETAINQYVYNIRDQLVLTWDAKGTKIYTKFDNLNRPVSSGFYTGTELVNTLRTNAAANNTWPTATITEFQRNYYDNLITTNYPAANQVAFSTNGYATSHATNLQGRLVGTVNSIFSLTGGTGLLTAPTSANEIRRITILNTIYYDSKGRIVQSGTKNHKDGFEYTHNKYDFVDRITATKQTTEYKHWTSLTASTTQSKTIELKTTYDEASRVQSVCQKIDADPWQPVTRNYYNDLGELNEKVQGCYVQRNNYKYNIRGWLTDINDLATFTTQATGSNPDLFAMHLDYNATGQYLGNITGQQWRTLKKRNDTPTAQEAFTYTYDNLNRTLAANYTGGRGGLSTEVYGTNPYDKNGNILKLKRSQLVGTTNTLVDDITYTYAANSNRLINTTDVSSKTAFYAEATVMPAVDEYSYDLAGNLTRDRNKVILTTSNINQGLAITYNGINLPSQMITTNNSTATNNGRINNYYLPNGQKIRTEYTNSTGAVQRSYDYLGGSIWVGGAVSTPATLDFIGTAEGRAILTARVYTNENNTTVAPPVGSPIHRYEYDLKDHLGNQRVACRCGDPKRATTTPFAIITGVGAGVEPTMMVQETHYDAWGVSFNQTTETQIPSGQTDRYLYNGKERIKELNVNWMDYGARYYDPMIGRWNGVDPMAEVVEENNPYNYCLNNPILLIDLDGLTADTSGTQKTIVLNDIVVTAKKLPPIEGFWQHVDYYWNGRSVDGIDYDKNGIPTGISPITGGPDLIGGVATGAFTVYKGIKLGLPYIGKSFNILKRYTKSERLTLQIESVIKGVPDKKLLRAIEQKILEYKKASGEVANKYNAFDPKRKDYPEYMEKASNWLEQNVPNWTKLFD